MAYNKFITTDGLVLLDLTADTITANKLLKGITAHDRSGTPIIGTAEATGSGLSITEPITITENGVYPVPKGGGLEYGKEVKFKEFISAEEFHTYLSTVDRNEAEANGFVEGDYFYVIKSASLGVGMTHPSEDWFGFEMMYDGTYYMYVVNNPELSDGWYAVDLPTESINSITAPTVVIPTDATMPADFATTAIFFDIETKSLDGWGDITVNVAGGGEGTSAIIKPLTITNNGTYTAVEGGELKYDTTVKFKQTITADDFATYIANATISQSAYGANIYTLFGDWVLMSASTGDSPMYIIQNLANSLLPLYTLGASAMGMADGWNLSDQTIVDDPPMVSIPEGATMSADLATTAVFFNLERIDGYAPITVKSKEVSAMIAYNDAYVKNETLYDDFVTDTRLYAFASCYTFRTIELPNVTNISSYCFKQCGAEIVKLPKATEIGVEAFNTSYIRYLDLSSCTELDVTQIDNNNSLKKLKLNSITKITGVRNSTLYFPNLTALILGGETVCEIPAGVFNYCYHITGEENYSYNPDGLKDGYIYVPKALVETYKTATNWSVYASQIRAIEDYPEECEF